MQNLKGGGTRVGGLKARETNKERYGADYYQKIGAKGGATPTRLPKGFAANPERAREAGKLGGRPKHKNYQPKVKADTVTT